MDELAEYNQERWEELAQAKVDFAKPWLDLKPKTAREAIDPTGVMGVVSGMDVLCLAASGGQQSAAFGLLGADATVMDISKTQLANDRMAADHYGHKVSTRQDDMRNLARFERDLFDVVYQAYSINFVPEVSKVFKGVKRVLRPGGLYRLAFANPFTMTVDEEKWTIDAWDEGAYPLTHPYIDGFETTTLYPHWDVQDEDGTWRKIESPREFRHALSTIINELTKLDFTILCLHETTSSKEDPEPGSWDHFMAVAVPYLTVWARKS